MKIEILSKGQRIGWTKFSLKRGFVLRVNLSPGEKKINIVQQNV